MCRLHTIYVHLHKNCPLPTKTKETKEKEQKAETDCFPRLYNKRRGQNLFWASSLIEKKKKGNAAILRE